MGNFGFLFVILCIFQMFSYEKLWVCDWGKVGGAEERQGGWDATSHRGIASEGPSRQRSRCAHTALSVAPPWQESWGAVL